MKLYKPLLLQVGILLLVLSAIVFFFEQRKQFVTVDFSKHYAQNKTIEIAGFEEGEAWQGNYSYDTKRVLEGKSSITLSSWYGKENTIQTTRAIPVLTNYTNGFLSIYVQDAQMLSHLTKLTLTLYGAGNELKEYSLIADLTPGWNRVALTLPQWKKITKLSLSILSQPESIVEINLDRFWGENTTMYSNDVFTSHTKSLSLRTIGARTYLFSASSELETYSVNSPTRINKGSVTVSLIPEHAQKMILSLNNTSITISNDTFNSCLLFQGTTLAVTKNLKTMSGNNDLYVFVKADVRAGKVIYSISNNGVDFEQCGTVSGKGSTPIELKLQGAYLIDSFAAEY